MWRRYLKAHLPVIYQDRIRFISRRLKSLCFAGRRYECPICGGRFRTLLPVRGPGRRNSTCPCCGSRERHRLIWLYLRQQAGIFHRRWRILHVAPEFCLRRILRHRSNLDYISIDLKGESSMVRMDVTHLQFPDGSFDGILCSHVLEHVPDDCRAMEEFYRVLKPGGWAVLNVPIEGETTMEDPFVNSPGERLRRYGEEDHVRLYGADYSQRLSAAGFEVTVPDFRSWLSVAQIERHRLAAEGQEMELLHVGSKRAAHPC